MNTLQTIYNKLSDKTELAKHEVELGLNQDLDAVIKKISAELDIANTSMDTLSSLKLQSDKAKVNAELSMKKLVSLYNEGMPIYNKIDKMGEELDIVIPNLNKYAQIFKDVEQEVSQIKMTIK
jgi:ABC-type phosphate transport system auxiliary subunit